MALPTRRFTLPFLSAMTLVSILSLGSASGKQHPNTKPPTPPESPTPTPTPAPRPSADLPADANSASLRVNALDVIYELDLSAPQLNAMRAAATGAAQTTARSPGKAPPPFLVTLKNFQAALLDGKDDQQIAKLRNQVIDMVGSDDVHLDTDIVSTPVARARSADLCLKLKASQIAAYLATHAEEVVDPQEAMMSAASALQDLHSDAEEKNNDGGQSANHLIQESAFTVGYLVAGMDDAKAQAIAKRVADWLRAAGQLSNQEFVRQHQTLEADAKKIVGDVLPLQVLNHWLEQQMADLLSNPQLPQAIDEMLKARTQP